MPAVALRRFLPLSPLFAWALYCLTRMVLGARRDPGPSGLSGDLPNWHNRDGDLSFFVTLLIVELAVVLFILRPSTYQRSWGRALSATATVTVWTIPFLLTILHSGNVMVSHVVWLLGVAALLGALSVASLLAGLLAARHDRLAGI